MPPKRKAITSTETSTTTQQVTVVTTTVMTKTTAGSKKRAADEANLDDKPAAKKIKQAEASTSNAEKPPKEKKEKEKMDWKDVQLVDDGEEVPVYDDCNEIRRKIRVLQKTPGFKVTHWLKEIGNINNNSYNRFMSAKGPTGGAGNGTYYAAYVYFEKVRIAEGKKKTPKRKSNEDEHPYGFPLQEPRGVWLVAARR